jgi:hypothetical protein
LFFRKNHCLEKSDPFPIKKRGLLARVQPLPKLQAMNKKINLARP